jgi:hypothetical protein
MRKYNFCLHFTRNISGLKRASIRRRNFYRAARILKSLAVWPSSNLSLQHKFLYLPPVSQEVNDGVLQQLLKIVSYSPACMPGYALNLLVRHFPPAI